MTCLVCLKRPARLSGRTKTCVLCRGGVSRLAHRRPQERTWQYRRGLAAAAKRRLAIQ
jgi:hypothetical protein